MDRLARYKPFLPLAVFYSACTTSVVAPTSPATVMLGAWSYSFPNRIAEAPALNTGLHVRVVIDSLDGTRFWGRVTFWFAGDVGISPSAFGRVAGSIDGVHDVSLMITREPAIERPLMVMGELAGDVLTVRDCHVGTEPGPFAAGSAFIRHRPGGPNQ